MPHRRRLATALAAAAPAASGALPPRRRARGERRAAPTPAPICLGRWQEPGGSMRFLVTHSGVLVDLRPHSPVVPDGC